MSAPRDTPKQIAELLGAGWHREAQLNDLGLWVDPARPFRVYHGADMALAWLHGEPPPRPYSPAYPWGP